MERSSARRAQHQRRPQTPPPNKTHRGLAYSLWRPDSDKSSPPSPGVVVVHGASSRKENHADFARLATANGWAALTFDLPGHGDSERDFSGSAVEDVVAMADLLAVQPGVGGDRVVLRGS